MDKALLILPVFLTLIIGVATQLEDIAKDTSDKAIQFSEDMNDAMDCATRGIPISQCSPQLFEYDFSTDLVEFEGTIKEIEQEINQTLP